MKKKNVLILMIGSILLIAGLVYVVISSSIDSAKRNAAYRREQDSIKTALTKSNYSRDSLLSALNGIAEYRPLASAMKFRDAVLKDLPYKIGQIVYLKPDSTKGVIENLVIEGNKYDYSVRFQILFANKTKEYINPEILFK